MMVRLLRRKLQITTSIRISSHAADGESSLAHRAISLHTLHQIDWRSGGQLLTVAVIQPQDR